MTPTDPPGPAPSPAAARHDLEIGIVAGTCVLALLYLGRAVLVPLALALILSLAIAPLVRLLKRFGWGQVPSVIAAGAALCVVLIGLAAVIGVQVAHIAAELPRYEETIRAKAGKIEALTAARFEAIGGGARKLARELGDARASPDAPAGLRHGAGTSATTVPVEIREPPATAWQVAATVLSTVWLPLQSAGIVLVVLLFVLLEHEALRDRFIRLAGGGTDLRATTAALNDAGERLSRFFVSQFAVNFGVGACVFLGLAAVGFPHAALWGVLTTALRFVPYVGVASAALSAALLAAAVDPGWALPILTLALYAVVETVATQLVEPQLYGHTTGLSPLSVVVAAIFWGWLWGPIGLVVSTPLTLCLVVAGHHVKALGFLDILLGDAPALTLPQRFYQRALSGDSNEIIAAARLFLKRRSLAAYCDVVLIRALRLTRLDLAAGAITADQLLAIRGATVRVVEALSHETRRRWRRPPRNSVLDELNPGRLLRHQREEASGRWQGPLNAPVDSIVICVGLGSVGDDLATEILVRVLRDLHLDARHLSVEDLDALPPPGAMAASVAMVCIVSVAAADEWDAGRAALTRTRQRFPEAGIVAVLFQETFSSEERRTYGDAGDLLTNSFEEAAQFALPRVRASPSLGSSRGTATGVQPG